jgi:hypothetical protein
MDLKIDLGQLSVDEDDFTNQGKEKNNLEKKSALEEEDEDSYDLNEIIMNSTNRTQRQIKPDNIPNLCLDLMDDEKSQSVAASLAKSMCKEINYKNEMEMIYNVSDNINQSSFDQKNKTSSINNNNNNNNNNMMSKISINNKPNSLNNNTNNFNNRNNQVFFVNSNNRKKKLTNQYKYNKNDS